MNKFQQIAVITGLVFLTFIFILALANFNNVILVMGLIAVLAVISGTVKVILLTEKRKELHKELEEFRDKRLEDLKRDVSRTKTFYYCPKCFYQSSRQADLCPACKSSKLKLSENSKKIKKGRT